MTNVDIGKEERLRDFQVKILDKFRSKKYMTCMAPRQHGKSTLIVMMIEDFLYRFRKENSRVNPYCLVAMRTMDQAFAVIFNRLMLQLNNLPEGYVVQQGSKSSGHIILTVNRPWFKDHVTIEFVGAGNLNAVKGRTVDFLLLDEFAFQPDTAWLEIFKPMIADTDGKAFITSTVNGRNHFWHMCKSFEELDKQNPSGDEGHIEFNIYTAGEWDEDKINREIAHHKSQNKMHLFNQEYMCDPDAVAAEEAPFSLLIGELRQRYSVFARRPNGRIGESGGGSLPTDRIYINFDIGKPGNNAVWEWFYRGKDPHIVGYCDSDPSQDAVIERIFKKYPGKQIVLIYPGDATTPSTEDGVTFLERRQQWLAARGWDRKVRAIALPRTKDKRALLFEGLAMFPNFKWDVPKVEHGLVKLSASRLRSDAKTGAVDYKNWVKNGFQHAADGFLYITAAINQGLAPMTRYTDGFLKRPIGQKRTHYRDKQRKQRLEASAKYLQTQYNNRGR